MHNNISKYENLSNIVQSVASIYILNSSANDIFMKKFQIQVLTILFIIEY